MFGAGQTPHGARPNRGQVPGAIPARAGSVRQPKWAPGSLGLLVEVPGRSLEQRSNALPRGMTVTLGNRWTEFGLQVRLPQTFRSFGCASRSWQQSRSLTPESASAYRPGCQRPKICSGPSASLDPVTPPNLRLAAPEASNGCQLPVSGAPRPGSKSRTHNSQP